MIVNHKYKFMFFAEPHTASRACSRMLHKIPGSELVGHHHMLQAYGNERELIPKSSYLRFSVIRDPRDVIATQIAHSWYNYRTAAVVSNPTPTLAELVERYLRAACARELFFYHAHYVDFKIRYERLENQLYFLLERLDVETIPKLEQFGVTSEKKPWWEYFDRSQIARMRMNIPEIEQFTEIKS